MKAQVLFVDDEPNILRGLRRMLRGLAGEWDMQFAESGAEALERLERAPVDVIVTDMRMPQMGGAELLSEVRERFPQVIRMVLSGQCDEAAAYSVAGSSHQFMSKPCNTETLAGAVRRALALRDRLGDDSLRAAIGSLGALPSPSRVNQDLIRELGAPHPSFKAVAGIVEGDIALSAKVMQLANSGYFGLAQEVTSPQQAMNLLGLETISTLVLSHGIVSQFQDSGLPEALCLGMTEHSLGCAQIARGIAEFEGFARGEAAHAFVAGMLHDVGMLALAAGKGEAYLEILRKAGGDEARLLHLEQARFGSSHATVGAYLLSLWGFPGTVVDAVAFHHDPGAAQGTQVDVLTAIHVAEAMCHERRGDADGRAQACLDTAYLTRIGALEKLDLWRAEFGAHDLAAVRT